MCAARLNATFKVCEKRTFVKEGAGNRISHESIHTIAVNSISRQLIVE